MTATQISTPAEKEPLPSPEDGDASGNAANIGSSAALISVFVIISRITGFMRTWAMAFALGSTMLASSYQVANNLPNMLYELVVGGMLVTAFLPVYISVKNKLGMRGGNEYASNLLSLTFIVLGIVAIACTIFAPALIYTQSFMNDQSTMDDAIFFFRFFAIQIVFYGISTIVSGLLNASRDYLWSSAAPIFNNIIVTATFVLYAVVAPADAELAKLIIAIGNPLGVFIQMAIQIPALRKNGIKLRFRVDLHDPALKETLSIGIPAIVVMFAGMVIVSVQNSAAYASLDNGPSIIAYARLWFTLPYAFLTVPITTAMFTEISDMHACGNMSGFKRGIVSGMNQIVFFMAPFMLYLIVFAVPLVTLYHIGAFTEDNINQIAIYLMALAVSLPFYGMNTYLQKIFSALRAMKQFAIMMVASALVQIGFIMVFATDAGGILNIGLPAVALSETVYYAILDVACFVYLRAKIGSFGIRAIPLSALRSLALGLLGALAGGGVMYLLRSTIAPLDGSIPHALICIIGGGLVALIVTFGIAIKLRLEEAAFVTSIVDKVLRRLGKAPAAPAPSTAHEENAALPQGGPSRNEPCESAPSETFAEKSDSEAPSRGKHSPAGVEAYRAANHTRLEQKLSRARHALPAQDTGHGTEQSSITAPRGRHAAPQARPNADDKTTRARHAR